MPRLTRAQPVRQRGGERRVVPDAAGELDRHVELADHAGQQVVVGPTTERRVEVDQMDPLGAVVHPGAGGGERVTVRGLGASLAAHQSHRRPSATSTAGSSTSGVAEASSCQRLQPVLQQRGTGVTGLLGVELGRA